MLTDKQDAFGHEIYDFLKGIKNREIVERDDRYFDIGTGAPEYFAPYQRWLSFERKAIRYARG